jgi:hypothetical protein
MVNLPLGPVHEKAQLDLPGMTLTVIVLGFPGAGTGAIQQCQPKTEGQGRPQESVWWVLPLRSGHPAEGMPGTDPEHRVLGLFWP